MKIVASSDWHGAFPEIPECDLLLIGGDVCPVRESHSVPHQRAWLREKFFPHIAELPAKEIVWIGGNHDFACEWDGWPRVAREESADHIFYLQNQIYISNDGLKIYGSPYVPNLPNWAFYLPDVKFLDLAEGMPEADIYLLHGPPKGILDSLEGGYSHVGAPYVEKAIVKYEIPNVIVGHIHECYGEVEKGPIHYRNVSHMDREYEPVNPPRVIDL